MIGPPGPDQFADNVADCLPDIGVESVQLGSARRTLPGRAGNALTKLAAAQSGLSIRLQQAITHRALDAELDLIITVDRSLTPETVKRLKSGGARVVLWFPDHIANLGNQAMLDGEYDRIYLTDPDFAKMMSEQLTLSVGYMPEACNPRWHRPMGSAGAKPGFIIAGNMYPSRVALLDRLESDGVPLRLYGFDFPSWIPDRPVMVRHKHEFLAREEKALEFRAASAVLNNLHPAENGANCRLFEAAGSGAAVLCEARDVIAGLFELGSEVLTFRDYRELKSHCQRLLEDPGLSGRLGDAAAARAHAEHTYQHRLGQILADVA